MTASRRAATALLVGVFLAGGFSGAGLMAWREGRAEAAPQRRGPDYYLTRLTRELDLDAGQQSRVRAVLDRYSAPMDSLWAEVKPRFETLRQSMRTDIRQVLTDAQRTKYEEMLRRHDAERSNAPGSRARP